MKQMCYNAFWTKGTRKIYSDFILVNVSVLIFIVRDGL